MDDATLGKLLTEAHRGQADYCEPESMSVSQSVSRRLLCSMDQGNLIREKYNQRILLKNVLRRTITASRKCASAVS